MSSLGKKLALAIASTVLTVLVTEGLARLRYAPERTVYRGLFEYDSDKVYALRKNLAGASFAGAPVTTNSFGHRDREISIEKPPGAFRLLAVGDSVTFGHGVRGEETWPEVLERQLAARFPGRPVDVINTAVPGNSPFQEYHDLERALAFQPDAAVIQFVLNDLIEPYKVFRRYGGKGRDYHRVDDVPWWDHTLSGTSAFYLFLKHMAARIRFGALTASGVREQALRNEAELSWNAGADPPTDPRVEEAWRECLAWMHKEVDLCRRHGLPVMLFVTPVRFQFDDPSRTYAQQRLAAFARENGLVFLDFLPVLWDQAAREIAAEKSTTAVTKALAVQYPREWRAFWTRHFLDYDHPTPEGHALAAAVLFSLIEPLAKEPREEFSR